MNQNKGIISEEEPICRYLLQSNQFSAVNRRVKYSAFMPAPNGETSVFRIKDLTEKEVWEIGNTEVAVRRNKPLKARGDVLASYVYKEGLELEPETSTHQLHANIINWPVSKSEKMLIATKIAERSSLHINPND